jgi:hypothetical protein
MVQVRRLREHLRPRRFRLHALGNGKSGTTSLARMFGSYRVGHEIEGMRMRALAARVMTGELDERSARVRGELRRRSVRYHLEVDVAGHMAVFAGTLARMYDDAVFVLPIRDCFSWLDSAVEQLLRFDEQGRTRDAFYDAKYLRHCDSFTSEEAALEQAGLMPVAAWLAGWADSNERVLGSVPPERLLVVRTEDLDDSVAALAGFAGVPAATLRPVHANRNPARTGLLGDVPPEFVVEQARKHCGSVMERFWGPDWCDLRTRLPSPPIR